MESGLVTLLLDLDTSTENAAGCDPTVDVAPVICDLETRSLNRLDDMEIFSTPDFAQHDVAFGTEPSSVNGMPVESYWSDAGIPEKDLSGSSAPTFIVSGSGDGSLIDLVAAATRTFDHAGMIRLISTFPGIDKVAEELVSIDLEARNKETAGATYDLKREYDLRVLPKLNEIGILVAVEDNIRPNLKLILQTRSSSIFNLQTSIFNRLAAYMVVTIYVTKSSFRHICAPGLTPTPAEAGETSSPLWFICNGERLGANKVFFRRGTDKAVVRAPFEPLLTQYPSEHAHWLAKHGSAVRVPRLLDRSRTLFKELASRYALPRAQYLEAAYPSREVKIQVEIDGGKAVWSGDLTPETVASVWNNEITDTKLFCFNSPEELGSVSLAVARIAIHAQNISLFGNKQLWEAFLSKHTKFSDTADDIPLPRISPLGTIGTQQSMQRLQPVHLGTACMLLWIGGFWTVFEKTSNPSLRQPKTPITLSVSKSNRACEQRCRQSGRTGNIFSPQAKTDCPGSYD